MQAMPVTPDTRLPVILSRLLCGGKCLPRLPARPPAMLSVEAQSRREIKQLQFAG